MLKFIVFFEEKPNQNLKLRVTNLKLVAQAQLQIMSFELC